MTLALCSILTGAGAASVRGATVTATAEADLEVQRTTVSSPASASAAAGASFTMRVDVTLKNNGPFGPVDAPVDFTLEVPADCATEPDGPFQTVTVSLEVDTAVPVSAAWSVSCSGSGARNFGGTATALAGTDDYSDPNNDNNFGESAASMTITPPVDTGRLRWSADDRTGRDVCLPIRAVSQCVGYGRALRGTGRNAAGDSG